jgi:hypothetical protein
VLRWLAVDSLAGGDGLYFNVPPVLAAEGDLIAAGVPCSSAKMEVSILDVRDAHVQARFDPTQRGDTGHSANRADGAEFEGWALDVGA